MNTIGKGDGITLLQLGDKRLTSFLPASPLSLLATCPVEWAIGQGTEDRLWTMAGEELRP